MKSNLFTIIKKEMARFFGDKRMVFTAVMPGILIYVMYTFMGNGFAEMNSVEEDYSYDIRVVDMPQALATLKEEDGFTFTDVEMSDVDGIKDEIREGEADLLLIFPKDFDEKLITYDVTTATEPAPNVEMYYNIVETESSQAYTAMTGILETVEDSLSNKFDVCAGEKEYNLASDEDMTTMMVSMLLPMLVTTFVFSGCLSAASESIAGEKERGTIATLLVTPMKRSSLAIGKLISLSIIGLISGCSGFIGTMLSLPKLMGGSGVENVELSYTANDYAVLFLVIVSTTLVIVGVISLLSALAKSVKEATTMATPVMVLTMVISFANTLGIASPEKWYLFLIPLYNSVQCMGAIFSMDYAMTPIIITVISNFVYAGGLVFVLTKMFNSERIMYTQ